MILDFGNIENISDNELWKLIDDKSNNSLTEEDIKCIYDIIKKIENGEDNKVT